MDRDRETSVRSFQYFNLLTSRSNDMTRVMFY